MNVLEGCLEIRVQAGRVRIEVFEDGMFTGFMGESVRVTDSIPWRSTWSRPARLSRTSARFLSPGSDLTRYCSTQTQTLS